MFKNKKTILIIIIAIILGLVVWQLFIKDEKPEFALERVSRGTVLQEISETGTVKISEETNLSFKSGGRIEKIYVKVGNNVVAGQELVKLDAVELFIQLTEAQAALEIVQADYNKLLAGASKEEIKVAETDVLNKQISLENAQQNLEDIEADANEDLDQVYEDALDTLDDSYLKLYNAFNVADSIYRSYFTSSDQEGINVKENRDKVKDARDRAKSFIDIVKKSSEKEDTDTALSEVKDALSDTKDALEVIRDMTENVAYRNTVSSSDKTSLDNQKSYINTAHSNVVGVQQTISITKITNETDINTAQADISTAEAQLQKAQDELNLLKAEPRQEDISLYQAKVKQAQAQVSLLHNQIQEATLRSPSEGQITKIDKREGEVVQSNESVISFLPVGPFQVKIDIYEEDIVDVRVGNSVKIALAAFPGETLEGKVVSIDPAEKLIDGIVYYEATIDFLETREGMRPGMTADIVIEADKREDVLVIPKNALKKINGKKIVQVFEKGEVKEREIEIGLEGDELVEVVSGLEEGEEIVID